ncbi:CPBP family intramembrane glutamic endopeptidase [Lapidilactobacillus luobeiensis]|uniref:CPBP family intramembrane glutamic endopeptidase n=1 Tax=Lapidilactobacillus luobeiensis TaxID=2950371 RepID=UPI0021C3441B|nr:CPBP family intramembrane glutamic endopeptidase [Lapidilactobacillus luobeiensis]
MKSPASRLGNSVRFIIFLALTVITNWLGAMAFDQNKISGLFTILFFSIAALTLLFFIRQFNLEKHYFSDRLNSLGDVFNNAFGFIIVMFLAVGVLTLLIAWLQVDGTLPAFTRDATVFEVVDIGFWLNILISGILIPIIDQYLINGFFFNYFFRTETPLNIVLGMLFSGVLFALLQFQPWFMPAFLQASFGWLFALSYLRTHNLALPILLNIFSAILFIVLG